MMRMDCLWRIDVGASGHVLLEDVVLDGAGDLVRRDPLFFRHGDVHGKEDRCSGVDGHGGGNLVQRNAVEENLHVGKRVDGDADLANFTLAHGVHRNRIPSGWEDRKRPKGRSGLLKADT